MKNPIDAIKGFGVGLIMGKALKAAAEGKLGRPVQWLYVHLNGLITIIGVGLILLGGAVAWLDAHGLCALAAAHLAWVSCATWSASIAKGTGSLGLFITWIGTVNGGLKLDPPDPNNLRAAFESLGK